MERGKNRMDAKFGRAKSLLKGVLVTVVLLLQVRGAEAQWTRWINPLDWGRWAVGGVRWAVGGANDWSRGNGDSIGAAVYYDPRSIHIAGETGFLVQQNLNMNMVADLAANPSNYEIPSITFAPYTRETINRVGGSSDWIDKMAKGGFAAADFGGVAGAGRALGKEALREVLSEGAELAAKRSVAREAAALTGAAKAQLFKQSAKQAIKSPVRNWKEALDAIDNAVRSQSGEPVAVYFHREGLKMPSKGFDRPVLILDPIHLLADTKPPTSAMELMLREAVKLQDELMKKGAGPDAKKIGSNYHKILADRIRDQLDRYPKLLSQLEVEVEYRLGDRNKTRQRGYVRIDALDTHLNDLYDWCFGVTEKSLEQINKQVKNAPDRDFITPRQFYIPYRE